MENQSSGKCWSRPSGALTLAAVAALATMYACTDDPANIAAPPEATFSHDGAPGVNLHLDPGGSTRTVAVNQALWQYPTSFLGAGILRPFLRVSNTDLEEGFNTDAFPLPLDAVSDQFTNPLPLNYVPVVLEPGQGTTLFREFHLDANEASSGLGPQFAIRKWDLWMCDDFNAPDYDAVSDFASNLDCLKVYGLSPEPDGVLRATTEFASGSGSPVDYRILVPNPLFSSALAALGKSPADCPYEGIGATACGVYLVLHTIKGSNGAGVEANWFTESTFEEYTTVDRSVQRLTIVKQIVNDNGGTATVSAFSINTTAGPLVFGAPTVNGTTSTYTSAQLSVPPGTFSLVEDAVAAYQNGAWSCTGATSFVPTFNAGSVTIDENQTAVCTIVNNDTPTTPTASLTLVKVVTNNSGGTATVGNFPLSAAGPTPITNQISGSAGATNVIVDPGSYVLSEQTVAGYQASSWACNGGSQSGSTVTLAQGQSATCTIGNDDIGARLTLVKVVTNNDGGTATLSNFPLSASGPTPITNQISGTAGATNVNVNAGSYVLSEQTVANYTATAWACNGGSLSGNTVTLASAQSATCTIGNDDVGVPGVDLYQDPGGSTRTVAVNQALWQYPVQFFGSAVIFPFLRIANNPLEEGFNTDGPPFLDTQTGPNTNPLPLNHVPVVVEPGQGTALWREFLLDANEANTPPGPQFAIRRWDLWMCDDPAAITYSAPTDFTSNAACVRVYSLAGGTNNGAVLRATTQFQTGSGSHDYRILVPNPLFTSALATLGNSSADCPYQGLAATPCGIYLVLHTTKGSDGAGVEAAWSTEGPVEEYTVIDRPVQRLTLVKQIVNDNSGTATVSAFSINTTAGPLVFGAPNVSGTTSTYTSTQLSVPPGTFSLVEGTVAGYQNGAWTCSGATSFVPTFNAGSVTIDEGQTAVCSIINNDTPTVTRLTLVKVVTNNSGGTATVGNFPLSAAGPTPITNQISGSAGATNVSVSPGSYVLSEQTVAGYQASSWACNGGSQSGSTVTLAQGQSATCTIGNDDIGARLTLVKVVTNNDGGTATVGIFPLSAAGPTSITNQISGTPGATNVSVNAGSYVLSEQTVASYTASAWACSGGSLSGNTVTLALAQSATCTIGNDDVGGTGGSIMLQTGDFTLLQNVTTDALSGSFRVRNNSGMMQSVQIQSVEILSPAVARVGGNNEISVAISGCALSPGAGTTIPPSGTLNIQVAGCDLAQALAQNNELRFVVRVVLVGGQQSEYVNTYKVRAN